MFSCLNRLSVSKKRLGEPNVKRHHPGQREQIGHYTQMVWKESTHVGFGAAISKSLRIYVVAHYTPRGNMLDGHPYKRVEGGKVKGGKVGK